jgi:hypothetical protein
MLWPCRSSQGCGTVRPSRDGPKGYLPAFSFFWLPRRVPRRCYQTHTNLRCRWPVWNQAPFVRDKEKSGSSTQQKRPSVNTVGLAVQIFPAATRTFTKDTALSEQGRGTAWHVWTQGMAWVQHGHGMLCVNWPLVERKVWYCNGSYYDSSKLCVRQVWNMEQLCLLPSDQKCGRSIWLQWSRRILLHIQ